MQRIILIFTLTVMPLTARAIDITFTIPDAATALIADIKDADWLVCIGKGLVAPEDEQGTLWTAKAIANLPELTGLTVAQAKSACPKRMLVQYQIEVYRAYKVEQARSAAVQNATTQANTDSAVIQ